MNKPEILKDAEVATTLYRLAVGECVTWEEVVVTDEAGTQSIVKIFRQIPPDVEAQKFWLENRQPKLWGHASRVDTAAREAALAEELRDRLNKH